MTKYYNALNINSLHEANTDHGVAVSADGHVLSSLIRSAVPIRMPIAEFACVPTA